MDRGFTLFCSLPTLPVYHYCPEGTSTEFITWITPLLVSMSAVVTFALLILTAPFGEAVTARCAPEAFR